MCRVQGIFCKRCMGKPVQGYTAAGSGSYSLYGGIAAGGAQAPRTMWVACSLGDSGVIY